ncbi:MAG: aspartate kinase [Clostridiales bacterium]|nr:aspartate kinase [Clostridiales bacterium]
MLVCKFGGTSMANAETISKVAEIVNSDPDRRYVVVSAPGKRDASDTKVTDLLYQCFNDAVSKGSCHESFKLVREHFDAIIKGLNLDLDFSEDYDEIEENINKSTTADYAASRGEYLSAKILAAKLGYVFLDAARVVKFNEEGELQLHYSLDLFRNVMENIERAVIPGFYGTKPSGEIKTFTRGGSDISGAIIARAAKADVYENWTDVDGFLRADPRIVQKPELIDCLTYRELRELAYMGANVLHPESIFPVRSVGIPINIRNTFNPDSKGTMIVAPNKRLDSKRIITGIAGQKGFTVILIEKAMMNSEVGFARKVMSVLEYENISFEHMPSGIDTLSIVIRDEQIQNKMQKVVDKIRDAVNADNVEIHSGLSLIATVGHNMASRHGTAATLFSALAKANINVRMIDQGSSELNIIVGVDTYDYEKAINAIYHAFMEAENGISIY